jgi:hypothetical protein
MAAAHPQKHAAASLLHSFPFRAAVLALCVALLPLIPTQVPEGAGAGQAFLAKAWELLHLLVVGIAVSYGLFSRKNNADDGRGGEFAPEKADAKPATTGATHVSRMFRDSLAPFDDDDYDETVVGPGTASGGRGSGREDEGGGRKVRSAWSAMRRPDEPVVVVTNASDAHQPPLALPVRMLKPQPAQESAPPRGPDETVLPSPIPWRSRSGRFDAIHQPASPRRLSPALSSSRETLVKATEYYSKRRSPRRSSSTISSPPPWPPPPPPPFLVHGYHPPATERRTAAKSFKEELQDHSMRGRGGDHYSLPNTTTSFNVSAAYTTTNASPEKPRSSVDGGSSSSSTSLAKSVRTFRSMEPPVFQGQSHQEVPEDAGDDVRVAAQEEVHGPVEPYGYRAYQSIPRFQYERSVSDPILSGVTVSSDETESSDDEDNDDHVGGGYSTRETTPEVDENEVDKKAEEFIARFREQIRLQRIESIKRSAGPRGVKHDK